MVSPAFISSRLLRPPSLTLPLSFLYSHYRILEISNTDKAISGKRKELRISLLEEKEKPAEISYVYK